ncbi:hypothetical protein [Bifidobacterium platyrrhinorum]|uniref:Uncharacterized protein n=1 Tax=Bifidobacterium platyrrhinorum TaxID=2661628 RepID=A0A6L9SU48_9BIFI|nr:hypothetical protein [Bifidobacterium platyrrhinorum]NEG56110.1 hypothetical protein [Bifidobacterium platyrrhinorum]
MTTRTINARLDGNGDTPAFRFAGRDAYYKTFGFGDWYGQPVATVASDPDGSIVVIGWSAGYIRGAKRAVEEQIEAYIRELRGEGQDE